MDRRGRFVGMVVFALGIAVLIFVFIIAYTMFKSPVSHLLPTAGGKAPSAMDLGTAVAWVAVRIGLLFIMTLAGSLIASKGIQLYLGSGTADSR
ncbi:MAG: hypothetical protein K6U00_01890 [Armatimonadetes bacterium]|nr:hypothetical protein [Armatimonadota bacterium]